MEFVEILEKKVFACHKVNQEIIEEIETAPQIIPRVSYRIQTAMETGIPSLSVEQIESRVDMRWILKQTYEISISPHFLKANQTLKKIKSFSEIKVWNDKTKEICKKLMILSDHKTRSQQLQIQLKNLEAIQEALGFFHRPLVPELPSTLETLQRKITQTNQNLKEILSPVPLVTAFAESTLLFTHEAEVLQKNVPGPLSGAKLLFRASRDGYSYSKFSENCRGKKPTILLAQSTSGQLFGGYLANARSSESEWVNDTSAFLYVLRFNQTLQFISYAVSNSSYAGNSQSPRFGDFKIPEKKGDRISTSGYDYINSNSWLGTLELYLEDYEVFQLF